MRVGDGVPVVEGWGAMVGDGDEVGVDCGVGATVKSGMGSSASPLSVAVGAGAVGSRAEADTTLQALSKHSRLIQYKKFLTPPDSTHLENKGYQE